MKRPTAARPPLQAPRGYPAVLVVWGTDIVQARQAEEEGRAYARRGLYAIARTVTATGPTRRSAPLSPDALAKCVARGAHYGRTWWLIPTRPATPTGP